MQRNMNMIEASEEEIKGYSKSELLGIAVMIIPFIISVSFFYKEAYGFLGLQKKIIDIKPGLISMLCSVVFYASLIVRYEGIFRTRSLFEAFISSVRTLLNCWVIAALIGIALPTDPKVSANSTLFTVFLRNPESTLLLFAILLSWLGMKTIAGYSWILFIVAAWKNMLVINAKMGMWGAVFVIAIMVSLFLQIRNYSDIRNFMREFRGSSSKYMDIVCDDINIAMGDASTKAKNIATKIDVDVLDVNKDGVVDMEDFRLLYQKQKDI